MTGLDGHLANGCVKYGMGRHSVSVSKHQETLRKVVWRVCSLNKDQTSIASVNIM
jgi:hypothetical protein